MTQNAINTSKGCLQFLSATTASVVTCTNGITANNTIPQNTSGTQVLTLSITPISASSKLLITFSCPATNNADASQLTVALFQDSTLNALAAVSFRANVRDPYLRYVMTSGTTSSTTFKINIGPGTSGQHIYVNADSSGNRLMGGVSLATLTIAEYLN